MIMVRKCCFLVFLLVPAFLWAADSSIDYSGLPLHSLESSEIEQLSRANMVMKVLDSYRDIRLTGNPSGHGREAADIQRQYEDLDPNFIAEAFFVLPVKPGEESSVLEEVKNFLYNVRQFEGIPYYSKHNGTWNPLFENMQILEMEVHDSSSEAIVTEQKMRPFKPYTAVYQYTLTDNYFLYRTFNRTPLYYKWMRGVKAEEMQTFLLVEAYPGYLFFYGVGGARAFDFLGLFGDRLDVAFTGRIEAFFNWFHKEFVGPKLSELKP